MSQLSAEEVENTLLRADDNGKIPIHIACAQSDSIEIGIVEYLIRQCPEAVVFQNEFGLNALHITLLHTVKPNIHIITLLCQVSHYACVMQRNKNGMLPIHIALSSPRRFNMEIFQLLLKENGALQLQEVDNCGYLPLHHAISNRHLKVEVIEYLLSVYSEAIMAQDIFGYVIDAIYTALFVHFIILIM